MRVESDRGWERQSDGERRDRVVGFQLQSAAVEGSGG